MQLSVVIPAISFNGQLEKCLKSIVKQHNVELDVWVVFNPRKPLTVTSSWPSWFHFIESEKGVNCARNLGLKNAKHDLVFFLDSDCELFDPNYLEKFGFQMRSRPHAAGMGGTYSLPANSKAIDKAYHYIQMNWLKQQILSEAFNTSSLIGGNMLLRKSKLKGSYFDEKIIFGGSEREFFVRLGLQGSEFYLDMNASVLHHSNLSFEEFIKKAKSQGRGEKYIQKKHKKNTFSVKTQYYRFTCERNLIPIVEIYHKIFLKNSKPFFRWKRIKNPLLSVIEHLRVIQSSKD
jgi:GT2 family glycosyltransferase